MMQFQLNADFNRQTEALAGEFEGRGWTVTRGSGYSGTNQGSVGSLYARSQKDNVCIDYTGYGWPQDQPSFTVLIEVFNCSRVGAG
jgi:hypothetical protein